MSGHKTITFEGEPYFLLEKERGVFQAVRTFRFFGEELKFEQDMDVGDLRVGENMDETIYRGPLLCLEYWGDRMTAFLHIASEARKFAEIAWYDYIALRRNTKGEIFQDNYRCGYLLFTPRLFRKARNN